VNSIKKIAGFKKAAVLVSMIGLCILFVTCVDNSGNKEEVVAKQDRYKQFAGSQHAPAATKIFLRNTS
jgi:hypothetical protein